MVVLSRSSSRRRYVASYNVSFKCLRVTRHERAGSLAGGMLAVLSGFSQTAKVAYTKHATLKPNLRQKRKEAEGEGVG